MKNYRLCRKPNILATINLRRLEWADHLVRMADIRTVRTYSQGNQTEEENTKTNLRLLGRSEEDLKWMGVE
jgi:hypothetical protein